MLCCCFRFRIPRTKQDIEADYQRRIIAKKFRERLACIKNSEMDDMDLQTGEYFWSNCDSQHWLLSYPILRSIGTCTRGFHSWHEKSHGIDDREKGERYEKSENLRKRVLCAHCLSCSTLLLPLLPLQTQNHIRSVWMECNLIENSLICNFCIFIEIVIARRQTRLQ